MCRHVPAQIGAAADGDGPESLANMATAIDGKLTSALDAGTAEIAKGLAKTENEWLDKSLGDVSDIRAAAETAMERHGGREAAAKKLRVEADKLLEAGAGRTTTVPLKNMAEVEDAIFKWRWLYGCGWGMGCRTTVIYPRTARFRSSAIALVTGKRCALGF